MIARWQAQQQLAVEAAIKPHTLMTLVYFHTESHFTNYV